MADQRAVVDPLGVLGEHRAVVRGEDDERVVRQTMLLELGQDHADRVVERADHARVDAPVRVVEVRETLVVLVHHLHRGVHRVEREVEEEGVVPVPVDEVGPLAGELRGLVLLQLVLLAALEHRNDAVRVPPGDRLDIQRVSAGPARIDVVHSGGHAVEVVEAAVERVEEPPHAELPLADRRVRVAGGLERVGDRAVVDAERAPGSADRRHGLGVQFLAPALLVAADHQAVARRVAHGRGHVAGHEAHPVLAERVDVRRRDAGAAVRGNRAVAEVVREQEDDVRLILRAGGGRRQQEQGEGKGEPLHGTFPFLTAFGFVPMRLHAAPTRNQSPASKYDCSPCDPLDRP